MKGDNPCRWTIEKLTFSRAKGLRSMLGNPLLWAIYYRWIWMRSFQQIWWSCVLLTPRVWSSSSSLKTTIPQCLSLINRCIGLTFMLNSYPHICWWQQLVISKLSVMWGTLLWSASVMSFTLFYRGSIPTLSFLCFLFMYRSGLCGYSICWWWHSLENPNGNISISALCVWEWVNVNVSFLWHDY